MKSFHYNSYIKRIINMQRVTNHNQHDIPLLRKAHSMNKRQQGQGRLQTDSAEEDLQTNHRLQKLLSGSWKKKTTILYCVCRLTSWSNRPLRGHLSWAEAFQMLPCSDLSLWLTLCREDRQAGATSSRTKVRASHGVSFLQTQREHKRWTVNKC